MKNKKKANGKKPLTPRGQYGRYWEDDGRRKPFKRGRDKFKEQTSDINNL